MKKHNTFLFIVPLFILSAIAFKFAHIITEKNIFQILCILFSILGPASFVLWFKLTRVYDNKKIEEEERILSNNYIERHRISIEFKNRYGISFTEFRKIVREQEEQYAKQIQNKDHKNAVILVLEDKCKVKYHFHELNLNGQKYFYLHRPVFLNTPNYLKSKVTFLNDIILDYWNEENLELYKKADVDELNKLIIHPYTDIVSIKTVEKNELFNHKMGAGEAMVKGSIYGGIATSLEMHERNQMGSTLVTENKHIITFKEELNLPSLIYNEKSYYNGNTVGLVMNRNKIFERLYSEPRFVKERTYSKLKDNAKRDFDRGVISRTEYEKKIQSIEKDYQKNNLEENEI